MEDAGNSDYWKYWGCLFKSRNEAVLFPEFRSNNFNLVTAVTGLIIQNESRRVHLLWLLSIF